MDPRDPKNYYTTLGLKPGSDALKIKRAYRIKAARLHPDRNPEPDAKERFQEVAAAYAVLGDAERRAIYDTLIDEVVRPQPSPSPPASADFSVPQPLRCSSCKRISAQPRYVIFYEITSLLFICLKTPVQGVFCSGCAEKKALQATFATWVFGWWGLPWGPIYSIEALLTNLTGGCVPVLANARLIAYQAFVFALNGQRDLAVAVAREAAQFIDRLPPSEPLRDELTRDNAAILGKLKAETSSARLKDTWQLVRRAFVLQALTLLSVAGWLAGEAYPSMLRVIDYFH